MFILENVPLNAYSTMRLGGNAAFLTEINKRQELPEAITWAQDRQLPIVMIGAGSNLLWADSGFKGLVLVNKITGTEIKAADDGNYYATAGAGENWDAFVNQTVEKGLTGLEFLSLIPGTVGATPIQNVGAYGQEVGNTIITIEAYDSQQNKMVTLRGSECEFGYRTSIFKTTQKGRYFITAVTFYLTFGNPKPPYYGAVEQYATEHDYAQVTPKSGREAVIAIRSAKLPDPAKVANNGSFFANPVIDGAQFIQIHADYQDVAYWNTDDNRVKVSAAWLIDKAGFKDFHDEETGMATWATQPLVLINEHAHTTADLLKFKEKIVQGVQDKFGITLEQEPELIG